MSKARTIIRSMSESSTMNDLAAELDKMCKVPVGHDYMAVGQGDHAELERAHSIVKNWYGDGKSGYVYDLCSVSELNDFNAENGLGDLITDNINPNKDGTYTLVGVKVLPFSGAVLYSPKDEDKITSSWVTKVIDKLSEFAN